MGVVPLYPVCPVVGRFPLDFPQLFGTVVFVVVPLKLLRAHVQQFWRTLNARNS